jgi:hypothetical protein
MDVKALFRSGAGSGLSTLALFWDSPLPLAAETDLSDLLKTLNLLESLIPGLGAVLGSPSCRTLAMEYGFPVSS